MFGFECWEKRNAIPRLATQSIHRALSSVPFVVWCIWIDLNSFSSFLSAVVVPIANKMPTENNGSWYYCLFADQIGESIHFPKQQLIHIFFAVLLDFFGRKKCLLLNGWPTSNSNNDQLRFYYQNLIWQKFFWIEKIKNSLEKMIDARIKNNWKLA